MIFIIKGKHIHMNWPRKPVKIVVYSPCSVSILDFSNSVVSISIIDFCRSATDLRFEGVCRKANRKKRNRHNKGWVWWWKIIWL